MTKSLTLKCDEITGISQCHYDSHNTHDHKSISVVYYLLLFVTVRLNDGRNSFEKLQLMGATTICMCSGQVCSATDDRME